MRKRIPIILLAMLLLSAVRSSAQSDSEMRQIYTQAADAYQVGQLDQAISLLRDHLSDFSGNIRQNVFRLLSLCYLAQDTSAAG